VEIIVESFIQEGEPSSAARRIRPVPGQGFDTSLRIECSREMRTAYPPGQLFRLCVTLKCREGEPFFLYAYHGDPWHPVSRDEAQHFNETTFGRARTARRSAKRS
jgi:hypothetical protein